MNANKILIVGEMHCDLFYKNSVFSDLIQEASSILFENFKDINAESQEQINKILRMVISRYHKKIESDSFVKRGGNGNNSAELLIKLGLPVKLMTVIGKDSSWMIDELKELGIDTDTIYQIEKPTPISTIVEDPPITKIFVAPKMKKEMNFNTISVSSEIFKEVSLVYYTPIAEKFQKIVNLAKESRVITAFSVELQKIKTLTDLKNSLGYQLDIMFTNLKDIIEILGIIKPKTDDVSEVEKLLGEIDSKLSNFSHIRVYTYGSKGSFVRADNNIKISIPIVRVEVLDQTGAGDTYSAGFLSEFYNKIGDIERLKQLYSQERVVELEDILLKCAKRGTYAAAYKVSRGESPTSNNLKQFIKELK